MLSLVLPTYNEGQNLPVVLSEIKQALEGIAHEVIVVDDNSPDRTWEIARDLQFHYPELKVIRRIGKRGLSSAVVDGFLSAKGDVLAVMDADGQHNAALVSRLYDAVRHGAGIAIGSRYVPGGDVGEWDGGRHILSRIATRMALLILRRSDVAKVRDPMSGFFAIDRAVFHGALPRLRPKGFKILFDILVHAKAPIHVKEVPLKFGIRRGGQSKLDWRVQRDFLGSLYDATLGKRLPFPTLLFIVLSLLTFSVLVPRLLSLRELYANAPLRTQIQHETQRIADANGWLLSDVRIVSATPARLVLVHQDHLRTDAPADCLDISLTLHTVSPCNGG